MNCLEEFTEGNKIDDGYYLILTDKKNRQELHHFIHYEAFTNHMENYLVHDEYTNKNIFYYSYGKCDEERTKKLNDKYFKN